MKNIPWTLALILALTLTACGASTATGGAGSTAQADSTSALSTEEKLILGTFQLEGTEQAVTAAQAAELLPLWQVYQDLLTSDTAAQAEIDALLEQIQETMTAEQMQAINAMDLSQQDVFAMMQEQGVGMSVSSSTTTTGNSSQSGGMTPQEGGGDMGAGAPPDTGGMPMGDTGGSSTVTAQNDSANTTPMNPASPLIEVLIELLQSKVNA